MPPVQTSYPTRPAAAYEGMAADQNPATILSRTVETPEGIGFGRAAFQGARDESIAAAGAVFRGIVLADRNARPSPSGADLTPAGAITAAASGNAPIPNALFDTSAPAGGLVRLRLN